MRNEDVEDYWRAIEERKQAPGCGESVEGEFPTGPAGTEDLLQAAKLADARVSRRGFLMAAGFSIGSTMLASCTRGKEEKAIPLLVEQDELVPGKSYWYASTCGGCSAGCGILVKSRDGRPIKIEGNPEHPVSRGGVCAVGQAMTLSLYDSQRLQAPLVDGKAVGWTKLDESIRSELAGVKEDVYFLTGTVTSPSSRAVIEEFVGRFRSSAHVEYDPVSYSGILDGHQETFGRRMLPHYLFERADVIVSFDADFLGTWISPVEFTKAYTGRRSPENGMAFSKHIQFEGRLSITGANADRRIKATPAECREILLRVAEGVASKADKPLGDWMAGARGQRFDQEVIKQVVEELWVSRGRSLVVCGSNDVGSQCVVNFINHVLGNYGSTLDIEQPSKQWNGSDRAVEALLEKIYAGRVKALFISDVNPAYSLPNASKFIDALKLVPVTVTFAEQFHETASLSRYVCPVHNFLESWTDAEVISGVFGVSQPVIQPTGQTRSVRESLTAWMGEPRLDLDTIQWYWRKNLFPRQLQEASFEKFWERSVRDGHATLQPITTPVQAFRASARRIEGLTGELEPGKFTLVLYEKVGMRDGKHAHNPWLQELPDPVTKAVWDNYVCLSPSAAKKLGIEEGELVKVTAGDIVVELPVQIQPGQHEQVLAIAVGYGRKGTDRFSKIGPQWLDAKPTVEEGATVGKNAFVFARIVAENILFENVVSIVRTGKRTALAFTQTHHTITVPENLGGGQRRDIVRETRLEAFLKDPESLRRPEHKAVELWQDDHKYEGHHWGMAIDLNRCTGCSACVVACQAENNVPVVGKDEVYRRREMHWIRIDRYYSGDEANVSVVHQPVMCQHCDHAPCETVCPVLATVHSSEGLNQQVYNRCIGTRYCENNCPYKVRRFNWFDYWREARKENLVLNPDVTTRSRGVMEKCSLCVQRIQEAKAEAKRRGVPLGDGDIKVACQQSCPGDAIIFGDMNDRQSRIAKLLTNPRYYHVLEDMNFRPAVGYLAKVRNRKEDEGKG